MDPTATESALAVPTAAALAPVFLLLLVGTGLRRSAFLGETFWPAAERLTYYVLFPALLFTTLSTAEIDPSLWPSMATAIAAAIAVAASIVFGLRPLITSSGPHFTSLLQGAIRMNTYVGLAVASLRYGPTGVALSAIAIAVIVPLVNLVCITALARCSAGASSATALVRSVAVNPLILATVSGALINASGVGVIPIATPTAEGLGRAALPIGLLTVGASLRWEALRRIASPELLVTAIKLVGLPTLTVILLVPLGVGGTPAAIAVLFTALPTAPSSYLLAQDMGGDSETMVSLITLQTVAAAVSLPLVLFWLT